MTATAAGTYAFDSVGFGKMTFNPDGTPDTEYFIELGYTNVTEAAIVAPNFRGIGLPTYLWKQVVNLLYHTSASALTEITCDATNGGICVLQGSCSSYASIWTYSFKIMFSDETNNNYINMPLGALAADQNGACNLYIQFLDETEQPQSSQVVLGSMFLQQFINYWAYDYSTVPPTTTYYMQLSASNTLQNSYIGNGTTTPGTNPFLSLTGTTQQVNVYHDPVWMTSSIRGSIGFQGEADFGVSLLTDFPQTFNQACFYNTGFYYPTECSAYPIYAEQYFNATDYPEVYAAQGDYEGFESTGFVFDTSLCMNSSSIPLFCTIQNNSTYVIDTVYADNWNFASNVGAGTIPLGWGSAMWGIFNWPTTHQFDVYFTNFNGASNWAPSSIAPTPVTTQSVINIGGYSADYSAVTEFVKIFPTKTPHGHLFLMDEFGFGKTNADNSAYYFDLLNKNETLYGQWTNTSAIQMNYRGVGLPTLLYEEFVNLLAIASEGQATCIQHTGGLCALPQVCEAYNDMGLWDYDFKIKYSTDANDYYLRVPLASFAADYTTDNGLCGIFVQYLSDTQTNSKQILLGGMFLQSFYAQFEETAEYTQVQLYKNLNALQSVYLGNQATTAAADPFVVAVKTVPTDPMSEMNGLPTFAFNVFGSASQSAYYYIDFTSDHSVVWQTDCMQQGIGLYAPGPCENEPTLFDTFFDPTMNSTGIIHKSGVFSGARFGGYVVDGTKYQTNVCLGTTCKFVQVYSVSNVTADNWLYGTNGAAGIIGFGPGSHLWNGFADPATSKVTYSIALARVGLGLGAGASTSNITFGGAADSEYTGHANMMITAEQDFTYAYKLSNLDFGIIYYQDGAASSEYMFALPTEYPVIFTTNFMGMGLPADVYQNVTSYLEELTNGDIECSATQDGICKLPKSCQEYESFENYVFKMNFASGNGNYLRVPLATFAKDVLISGGAKQCNLEINYLNSLETQSNQIILGGMFYQEFFSVFVNDLLMDPVDQSATIYVNNNAMWGAYVGNQVLEQGANPFVPPTPQPEEKKNKGWVIALSIICGLLLVALGVGGWWYYKNIYQASAGGDVRPVTSTSETSPLTNNHSDEV